MKKIDDSWNADLYDQKHLFVSQYGNQLIDMLAPQEGEKILDVGCGTGDLANKINEIGADVEGIDQSENMVMQAKNKYPLISFKVGNATRLEYKNEFNAVFSNATLHWVKPPFQALQSIYKSLKQGGRFVAEFGGKGNVRIITDEIQKQGRAYGNEISHPWYFPSIGEYTTLMEDVGFKVIFAQHFERPTPLHGDDGLKNWIEMFTGNMFDGVEKDTKSQIISSVEKNLKDILYKDGNWIADYKRIRVYGIKE